MKIVVIGQWILPYNTPRAYRTWNLAEELAEQGHDVTVYALLGKVENNQQSSVKIKSLGCSYLGCIESDGRRSFHNIIFDFISKVLRRLFFKTLLLPDIELMRLVRKVLRNEENIDLLITIAYPHPIHWGALGCKSAYKVKRWISDCGDPFMNNPFFTPPSYFKWFENRWYREVDYITIPVESARSAYNKEFHNKIQIIPQGFKISSVRVCNYIKNPIPTFAFAGSVFENKRDPSKFLQYLCNIKQDFKFIVYTQSKSLFLKNCAQCDKIEIHSYIERESLLKILSSMDFLINILNEGDVQTPSKLIDYAIANRPILSISSKFDEQNLFEEFLAGNYKQQTIPPSLKNFDIKNIAKQFVNLAK